MTGSELGTGGTRLRLFTHHLDDASYLEALRAARGGGLIPVLGPPTDAHRVVDSLSEPVAVRASAEPGAVVVASPAGSRVADIAAALAHSVGGRHVEMTKTTMLGAAAAGADHVALVALADEIDDRSLAEVHDSLWRTFGSSRGGHLGALLGEHRADVSWLIAKGLGLPHRCASDEPPLRVWSALQSLEQRPPGRLVLADESRVEVLRPLLTGTRRREVSFVTHGRDDTIIFHDTVVCSTGPLRLDAADKGIGTAPVCAFTGQCYRPEVAATDVLRAGTVLADAVFANTCMAMHIGDGLFPTRYLLPFGFVRGVAAAYFGSAHVVNGLVKLADLFHAGCAAGASLGEIATVMNDHLRYERVDLPYFTVLGLPWAQVAEPNPAAWDRFTRVAPAAATHWGAVTATALSLAAEELGSGELVLAASPRSAAVVGPAIGTDVLDSAADLSGQAHALGRSMTNLDDVPNLGLRYARHGNVMNNLRNQVTTLAAALSRAALVGDTARLRRRLETVASAVERAELDLAAALMDRGTSGHQSFSDLWGERFELDEPVQSDDKCPYCLRPLVHQHATHSVFARLSRSGLVCPRCVMVQDVDDASPVTAPGLDCAELWPRASDQRVRLRFTLDRQRTTRTTVAAAVFVANAGRIGIGRAVPEAVRVDSAGRGELTVELAVTEVARMHQEYVRGLVVAEGTIMIISRPVWVRPSGSARDHRAGLR